MPDEHCVFPGHCVLATGGMRTAPTPPPRTQACLPVCWSVVSPAAPMVAEHEHMAELMGKEEGEGQVYETW